MNTEADRYIYTRSEGWIDMSHFLFYAGRALAKKEEGLRNQEITNYRVFHGTSARPPVTARPRSSALRSKVEL